MTIQPLIYLNFFPQNRWRRLECSATARQCSGAEIPIWQAPPPGYDIRRGLPAVCSSSVAEGVISGQQAPGG
jgi:hypothetical protein